jgi:sugar phosphate isomerase/epimerase
VGSWSICPTSTSLKTDWGTADEHLALGLRVAAALGSPVFRVILGSRRDRTTEGGIDARMADTVRVLRAARARALDLGVKIAVENHAGDMQGRELKTLIEGAGPEFVGACLDSGNPVWTLEDPHLTLEVLAPYVLTSHIRDSYLWDHADGTAVRWVRMGEGNVDIQGFLKKFMQLCPGRAMSLEIIVTGPRTFAWKKSDFWNGYRTVPAWQFTRFLDIAAAGKPQLPLPAVPKEKAAEVERDDFEASTRWFQSFLASA